MPSQDASCLYITTALRLLWKVKFLSYFLPDHSNTVSSLVFNMPSSTVPKEPEERWESLKDEMGQMFLVENTNYNDLSRLMAEKFGFHAR